MGEYFVGNATSPANQWRAINVRDLPPSPGQNVAVQQSKVGIKIEFNTHYSINSINGSHFK